MTDTLHENDMATTSQAVVLASGNAGKLREFQELLAPLGITLSSQADHDVPEVEETGLTFVENALLKARAASRHTGLPALADDSGLVVDALNGAPGIYSARYSGEHADDAANNRKLLDALRDVPEGQRQAHYWCALVYLRHADDPAPLIIQCGWKGDILSLPRGEGGFGYDPLFWVSEAGMSAAEMSRAEKNRLSHRGRAVAEFIDALKADNA
ncbi:xanthosine triphosphate pyrophosphatase [Zymobacter palmae]|uniref:dITP/XTP pyrophosphatase n=2 Tax=Zymobacter group TaxID=114403 RepID=A0A348HB13_9GAMM|nr:xanthosine triphosphate pyrophosphatase [Zymobacter palmae]